MIPIEDVGEVRSIQLRSSGMADWERCPRKFLFRHRMGLVPRRQTTDALHRGTVLHQFIARVLAGSTVDEASEAASTDLKDSISEVLSSVGPSGYIPSGKTAEEAVNGLTMATHTAVAMSRAYCRFFQVSKGQIGGFSLLSDDCIEVDVENPDEGTAGTLDAIMADRRGDIWVVDHKTCGWDPKSYARTLSLAPQSIMYPRLLEHHLQLQGTPVRVRGIHYNIIRTPTIRCCGTDDHNPARYAERVERWYEDNDSNLLATLITMGPEHRSLHSKRVDSAQSACVSSPSLHDFPATGGSACQAYNTLCPFIELCTTDTATWPTRVQKFDTDWRDEKSK